jgi:deoxycytidylate deaminase
VRDFILQRAVQEALKSTVIRGKLGAVVFDKKAILGSGRNHFCARTRYPMAIQHRRYPFSVHAEMAALLDAGPAARGADLLVVRMRHDGTFGMALPCPAPGVGGTWSTVASTTVGTATAKGIWSALR